MGTCNSLCSSRTEGPAVSREVGHMHSSAITCECVFVWIQHVCVCVCVCICTYVCVACGSGHGYGKCSAKIFKMYIRASISMCVHGYFQLLTSLSCFMNTNSTLYVHLSAPYVISVSTSHLHQNMFQCKPTMHSHPHLTATTPTLL